MSIKNKVLLLIDVKNDINLLISRYEKILVEMSFNTDIETEKETEKELSLMRSVEEHTYEKVIKDLKQILKKYDEPIDNIIKKKKLRKNFL